VYRYLFPKKEGRGSGVLMDADVEGLVRRSRFWVGVWGEVRSVVGEFGEGGEGAEGVDKKRKREEVVEVDAGGEGEYTKKGRYYYKRTATISVAE